MFPLKNKFLTIYVFSSFFISIACFLSLLFFIFYYSFPAIIKLNIKFFTDTTWLPYQNQFSVMPMIYGSLSTTLIALIIVIPLGILTVLFISEILPNKIHHIAKSFLELLAGIPSIVYGLIATTFFAQWIRSFFHLDTGRVILTGGIVLAIMVLPTFITLVDDSFRQIPNRYKEAAFGIGFYPYQVYTKVLLPMASEGILNAILLSFGRAIGETMAVMLVIGSIDKFSSILDSGQTLTSKIGREINESVFGSIHFSALIFLGFILLILSCFLTIFSFLILKNRKRLND